jgi:hypothetical protein
MLPEVISSNPAIMRIVEDFPQPDGPRKAMNSLSAMSRDMPRTASTFPYFFHTSSRITEATSGCLLLAMTKGQLLWRLGCATARPSANT